MWSFVIADIHSQVLIRSHGEVIVCSSSQSRQQKEVDLHQIKRIMESACVGVSIPAYDTCPTISDKVVGGVVVYNASSLGCVQARHACMHELNG